MDARNHGKNTSEFGLKLEQKLRERGYDVYTAHAGKGDSDGILNNDLGPAKIASIDIVIAKNDQAVMLIEIEESSFNPKVILGDLWALLFSNEIVRSGGKRISVTDEVKIIVAYISGSEASGDDRLKIINHELNKYDIKRDFKFITDTDIDMLLERLEEQIMGYLSLD